MQRESIESGERAGAPEWAKMEERVVTVERSGDEERVDPMGSTVD